MSSNASSPKQDIAAAGSPRTPNNPLSKANLYDLNAVTRQEEARRRGYSTPSTEPDLHEYNSVYSGGEKWLRELRQRHLEEEMDVSGRERARALIRRLNAICGDPPEVPNLNVPRPRGLERLPMTATDGTIYDLPDTPEPETQLILGGFGDGGAKTPRLNLRPIEDQLDAHLFPMGDDDQIKPPCHFPPSFQRHHPVQHADEIEAYLANASYVISLDGPPSADLKYGVIIVKTGNEMMHFGERPADVFTQSFLDDVDDAKRALRKQHLHADDGEGTKAYSQFPPSASPNALQDTGVVAEAVPCTNSLEDTRDVPETIPRVEVTDAGHDTTHPRRSKRKRVENTKSDDALTDTPGAINTNGVDGPSHGLHATGPKAVDDSPADAAIDSSNGAMAAGAEEELPEGKRVLRPRGIPRRGDSGEATGKTTGETTGKARADTSFTDEGTTRKGASERATKAGAEGARGAAKKPPVTRSKKRNNK
ncbi:hypothetical protein BGZ61DRAFT_527273 [Ilyonectria robusta]|uniref:uncharacterized protein n=1 Tax=Ilyonectria robusta TaxID=1079257 RepID=UPI001E8C9E7D|nr:uncharacterized protein BGZ61DRAFT_527273 [Ilyonectria robusta]KAH8736306.1 hypothetical protein BGZ61DRAFT_527273 [Ilyonectria robusta]